MYEDEDEEDQMVGPMQEQNKMGKKAKKNTIKQKSSLEPRRKSQ